SHLRRLSGSSDSQDYPTSWQPQGPIRHPTQPPGQDQDFGHIACGPQGPIRHPTRPQGGGKLTPLLTTGRAPRWTIGAVWRELASVLASALFRNSGTSGIEVLLTVEYS